MTQVIPHKILEPFEVEILTKIRLFWPYIGSGLQIGSSYEYETPPILRLIYLWSF